MSDSCSAQPRTILNANKGISNVIEQKVIRTDLQRVTNELFEILKHHYGPYSGFAAIDDNNPLNETKFTKDGIGIVRAIEYVAPQEEWVRKTIAYIGSKMETSVGDGTTSSMMFTCAMLRHMSEHLDELRPLSYHKFRTEFDKFVDKMKYLINTHYTCSPFEKKMVDGKETEVLNPDTVYQIVFNQVYTSSHGDRELARTLAEMYKQVPKEQWERMTYERRRYESEKRFEVVASGGQYTMDCNVMTTSMLNKDLCTWFDKENCTVIIMNDSWRIASPDWEAIMKQIDESSAIRPVVIICHTTMDSESYQKINEKIEECDKAGKPFAVFTSKPEHPSVNDYVALQSIIGVDICQYKNGEAVIVDGVHVTYKNKRLSLDGIVEIPEGHTSNERHQVTDMKHAQFTDVLETWKHQADYYAAEAMSREEKQWANYYNRMYVKLRYNKTYTVVIGGKSYDNVAFVDVLDDAIRAASRALKFGGTFGNNRALFLATETILKHEAEWNKSHSRMAIPITYMGDCDPDFTFWFAHRVQEALTDLSRVVLDRIYPKKFFFPWNKKEFSDWWFHHAVDLLQYDITPSCKAWTNLRPWESNAHFKSVTNTLWKAMDGYFKEDGFICQPANSDIIMLERFGEVALKFILSERVIIHGGAYVAKKR